jgi:hypothetical protein
MTSRGCLGVPIAIRPGASHRRCGFGRDSTTRVRSSFPCASSRPFRRPTAAESLFLTPGLLPFAPSGPPSAFAPLLRRSESPKKSNQKKGDPDEAPSLREGARRAYEVSRRHIRVPTRNSRTSCARHCVLLLRPAAASYGVQIKIKSGSTSKSGGEGRSVRGAAKPSASLASKSVAVAVRFAYGVTPHSWVRTVRRGAPCKVPSENASIRHPGERRDPAVALDLDLGSRRWRRAAEGRMPEWPEGQDRERPQPGGGERRRCLRPWRGHGCPKVEQCRSNCRMAEFGAGRRPASSAGDRSGFIGPAPASGVLSLGYFSLHEQREVTRTPKAGETGRESARLPTTQSRMQTAYASASPAPQAQ